MAVAPNAPDQPALRAVMARLPTGVTVVSAPGPQGPTGATASAVGSLSLRPPLMLACLDRGSRTLAAVLAGARFGVSVLRAEHGDLARAFATKAPHPEKWAEVAWSEHHGVPILDEALAWVACELRERHDGGDHEIVTGEVAGLGTAADAGNPLVFWGGSYRSLGA